MNGTFAQGNPYIAPQSGVGAYIPNGQDFSSPTKTFVDTYDTVNRWKAEKERERMLKQQYVKANFPSLDYSTEGILPSQQVKDWFVDQKEKLTGIHTSYGIAGQDPTSVAYKKAYAESEAEMKKQKVAADVIKQVNLGRNALLKSIEAHPELYDDLDAIGKWDEELMNAPVEGEGNIFEVYSRMPKPKAAVKTVDQRWMEGTKDAVAAKETYGKQGAIYESTTYPKTSVESVTNIYHGDKKLQKQTEDELNPLLMAASPTLPDGTPNPDFSDAARNQLDALQKYTDAKAKEAGRPLTIYEGYNIQAAERQKPNSELFKSWSPYTTASAKIWASGQEDKKMFENNILELLKIQSQDADYTIDPATGDKVYPNAINRKVGVYQDPTTGKSSDNLILDLRADIDPTTEQAVYKVATTESKNTALKKAYQNAGFSLQPISGAGGKKEWFKLDNEGKYVSPTAEEQNAIEYQAEQSPEYYNNLTSFGLENLFSKAYEEKDRGKFLNYYQKVAQEMGIYDNSQKTATAKTIKDKKVFDGWGENVGKKDLLNWQEENITLLASVPQATPEQRKKYYTRLMPEQRVAYDKWQKANPTRNPTPNELRGILGLKQAENAVKEQPTTQESQQTTKSNTTSTQSPDYYNNYLGVLGKQYKSMGESNPEAFKNSWSVRPQELDKYYNEFSKTDNKREKGALLTNAGYKAIDAFENSKGTAQGTSMNKGDGYARTQEAEIKKYVEENIGLDVWNKMPENLQMQVYSLAFNSVKDGRIVKGLAQAVAPDKIKTDEQRRNLSITEAKKIISDAFKGGGVQKKYNAGGKSYSEKELIDLGYTKEQIDEAVKLGNVTIE